MGRLMPWLPVLKAVGSSYGALSSTLLHLHALPLVLNGWALLAKCRLSRDGAEERLVALAQGKVPRTIQVEEIIMLAGSNLYCMATAP